jgi:hypothetical protein
MLIFSLDYCQKFITFKRLNQGMEKNSTPYEPYKGPSFLGRIGEKIVLLLIGVLSTVLGAYIIHKFNNFQESDPNKSSNTETITPASVARNSNEKDSVIRINVPTVNNPLSEAEHDGIQQQSNKALAPENQNPIVTEKERQAPPVYTFTMTPVYQSHANNEGMRAQEVYSGVDGNKGISMSTEKPDLSSEVRGYSQLSSSPSERTSLPGVASHNGSSISKMVYTYTNTSRTNRATIVNQNRNVTRPQSSNHAVIITHSYNMVPGYNPRPPANNNYNRNIVPVYNTRPVTNSYRSPSVRMPANNSNHGGRR